MTDSPYRALPGIDTVLATSPLCDLALPAELRAEAARQAVEDARLAIAAGRSAPTLDEIAQAATAQITRWLEASLRGVLNATGVVVHTNLGRAPLTRDALDAAAGACNLEYDLETGRRGSRRQHVESLLIALSGAEAALVVNNNAGAVVLMLAGLAAGREVLISRSELVEIGGSFRIPDIMGCSGAILREVGTTNRTYIDDYAKAIGPETGAILRVHPSNFQVTGFVHRPAPDELAELARAHELPFLHDLGSGTFGDLPQGLDHDGDPRAELAAGADLLCFSGDKLLGGPQAGILLGQRRLVDALASHPLARALRVGKLTMAAMEHTLLGYRTGSRDAVPVWGMLHATVEQLEARARRLAGLLGGDETKAEPVPCEDAVGGGSHPGATLPGAAVSLQHRGLSPDRLAARLRAAVPPVICTIADDRVRLHLRTVPAHRDDELAQTVLRALPTGKPGG